ncbi:MAG: LamG-like jellyroll fold domain-containing protein [Phycisphaerae bacterium]
MTALRRHSARRGFALGLVMMFMAVAITVGLSYLASTSVKTASSKNLTDAIRSEYVAESGVMHGLELFRSQGLTAFDSGTKGPFYPDSSTDSYRIRAVCTDPANHIYRLTSTGTVGNIQRVHSAEVKLSCEYRQRVVSLGPIHYWRLGESGGDYAADLVGTAQGRYRRSPILGQSGALYIDTDTAVQFDGIDDYVDLDRWNIPGNQMTIMAWAKADHFSVQDGRIISKANGTSKNDHVWMISYEDVGSENRLRFRLSAGGSVAELEPQRARLTAGKWFFVAVTYDGSRMRIYQDGEEVASCAKSGTIKQNNNDAWIGGNPPRRRDRPWPGKIDEVAVFDKALTKKQIRGLYKARWPKTEIVGWIE